MQIIYQKLIFRSDLKANPGVTYVFGDNCKRFGLGGQAKEMRGEPNALGIATLWEPGKPWTDETFDGNVKIIDNDLRRLRTAWSKSRATIWPADGIGTGFAMLPESAPKTYTYLVARLRADFGIENGVKE